MTKVVSNKAQLAKLVRIMEENIEVARGLCSKVILQQKWQTFSIELNKLGPPQRKYDKWQRVWNDLKFKVKKKALQKKTEISNCGGSSNYFLQFSDLEESVIRILQLETALNLNNDTIELGATNIDIDHVNVDRNKNSPTSSACSILTEKVEQTSKVSSLTVKYDKLLQNILDSVNDLSKNTKSIEQFTRKSYYLERKKLKLKQDKLKILKNIKKGKEREKKIKLDLKVMQMEIEKQKQSFF